MIVYLDNYAGHATFKRQKPYWDKWGIRVTSNPNKAHIHLANVRAIPKGLPIVQRLDGIYYDSATPFKTRNSAISATHGFAAGVIYQSDYCRRAGEHYLAKRKGPFRVIYNGIEPGWAGPRNPHSDPVIVVSAKWRRHKRLPEILKLFKDYREIYHKAILIVMGDLRGSPNPESNNPGVRYVGHISHDQMRSYFRQAWFSLHLSKRDACPNSTVEAIGAGVPVITTDACGGGTEMCYMTPQCVVIQGDDISIQPAPHYTDKYNVLSKPLHHNILQAMITLTQNQGTALSNGTTDSLTMPQQLTAYYMAKQYIDFFKEILKQ